MIKPKLSIEKLFNLASIFLLIVIALFLLYLLILGAHLAFPAMNASKSDWIGMFSSIIGGFVGGLLTLLGVRLTIKHNEIENNKDKIEKYFSESVPLLLEQNSELVKEVTHYLEFFKNKFSAMPSAQFPYIEIFIESAKLVTEFNAFINANRYALLKQNVENITILNSMGPVIAKLLVPSYYDKYAATFTSEFERLIELTELLKNSLSNTEINLINDIEKYIVSKHKKPHHN